MRRTTLFGGAGAAIVTLLLVGACSGDSESAASHAPERAAAGSMAAAPAATRAPNGGLTDSGSGGKLAPIADGPLPRIDTSAKIRRVSLTVALSKADEVAGAADRAGTIVAGVGGDVYGDTRSAGEHARATVILKVPPADLTRVLGELSKLGVEKSRSSTTEDVTQRVADVDSRVRSLQREIAELRSLYDLPNQKLSAILQVEQELAQRQADLESMQAQQRSLQAETATATVTLQLVTKASATKRAKKESSHGFLAGLGKGWDAFVAGAVGVATAFGAVLPFLVLLLILAGAARLLGVRLPRRRVAPVPAPVE